MRKTTGCTLGVFVFLLIWLGNTNAAELSFSRHYSDHMVLQREKPVLIRGFAGKEAEVTVTFGSQSNKVKADKDGEWSVTLDPVPASKVGADLTAQSAGKSITLSDVLIGDVFLFARQTTIDVSLGRDEAGRKAASNMADNPLLRVLSIKAIPSEVPQPDLAQEASSGWNVVDKASALTMSSAAFNVAEALVKEVDVPIGVIDLNMGYHFPIAWLSKEALLETKEVFGEKANHVKGTMDRVEEDLAEFNDKDAKKAADAKRTFPAPHPLEDARFPAAGYNAVLHPMRGLGLKGLFLQMGNDYPYVHYQKLVRDGNDTDRLYLAQAYKDTYDLRKWCIYLEPYTTPRIPREWRKTFGDDSLPVGWITPPGSDLTVQGRHHMEMRELQRGVAEKEKGVDLILSGTEHIPFSAQPADEAPLAARCLSWLMGSVYKKDGVVSTGPLFDHAVMYYSKAQVFFKDGTAKGLKAMRDALNHFEVAGTDLEYFPAQAVLDGETIRIKSDKVGKIMHVRYDWSEKPAQALVNSAGLPAVPFSTDGHDYPKVIDTMGEEVLPDEFFKPVSEWKSEGAVIVNGALNKNIEMNNGETLGTTGLRVNFFGPNLYVVFAFKGSPADGKILPGDFIYGVNGKLLGNGKLFDEDMLADVAEAITYAETEEGQGRISFNLMRDGKKMTVELTLEVLGSFSTTFPYDCEKTDRIVANAEAYIAKRGGVMSNKHCTFQNADALFLLAAGTPEYQGLIRRHMYNRMNGWDPDEPVDPLGKKTRGSWAHASDALFAGEYYMATGDTNVLPFMQYCCDGLTAVQYRPSDTSEPLPVGDNPGLIGGWRHNFQGGNLDYPTMPAISVPAAIGYHLTKEAGVQYDFAGYDRAVNWFLHNGAKVGHIQYGASREPVTSTDPIDNDKLMSGKLFPGNGGVAGAAILFELRENYPVARMCSLVATYSFNNTAYAHGGNFWSNLWTPLGAKVHGKKAFQTFMKGNRNFQELHRMFDHGRDEGSAGMGVGQFLAYVAPRERLRILGAHESVFAANPPEALLPALEAYRKRDYAACESVVSRVLEKGDLHLLDLQKAEQLKDQVVLLQKSIALDLAKVKRLIVEKKLYEASLDLLQLKAVVPSGDPDLAAIEAKISDPAMEDALAKDEQRYGEYLKSLSETNLKPAPVKEDEGGEWKGLVIRDNPADSSDDAIATKWRMKIVESLDLAPDGWIEKGFDDSKWTQTTLPISWYINHSALLRAPFEIADKSSVKALRLRNWAFRQQNMQVYINGKLVAKISPSGSENGEIEFPLNNFALKALKNGRNTLAATYENTWRWGRYVRSPDTLRSSSVYNHGVHLILEMKEKE